MRAMLCDGVTILADKRDWVPVIVNLGRFVLAAAAAVLAALWGASRLVKRTALAERDARREQRQEEAFGDVMSLLVAADQAWNGVQSVSAPNYTAFIARCRAACEEFERDFPIPIADMDAFGAMRGFAGAVQEAEQYGAWVTDEPDQVRAREASRTVVECRNAQVTSLKTIEALWLSPVPYGESAKKVREYREEHPNADWQLFDYR